MTLEALIDDKEFHDKSRVYEDFNFRAFYEYYKHQLSSAVKVALNELDMGRNDKTLIEIEDWGTIYYGTVFSKQKRRTPMGAMARYLEKLWIYVAKKIK